MNSEEKLNASTAIYLDTRWKNQNSLYPVKLRVTYKRKTRLFKTKFYLTEVDFERATGKKSRQEYKVLGQDLIDVEKKAMKIIKNMKSFSFDEFKRRFLIDSGKQGEVFPAFNSYITQLKGTGQLGTASSYECAKNSLKTYFGSERLTFSDVTSTFLKKYENWMLDSGKSQTTVGIYLRSLRTIFNRAIQNAEISGDIYPFGSGADLYTIPSPNNVKKALGDRDLKALYSFKPTPGTTAHFYFDLWWFSYMCNGINIKDICLLRYRDIKDSTIIIRRAKTTRTNRNSSPIVIQITELVNEIIGRWGQKPANDDQFIFPLLKKGMMPDEQRAKIQQVTKMVNKYIDRAKTAVQIDKKVTSYTARHSFSTKLLREGVDPETIRDELGHNSITTTQKYLKSIETDDRKKLAESVMNFVD